MAPQHPHGASVMSNVSDMRLFAYKMARDYGFAPNPFHSVCTLATCKPRIRSAARPGDLIVACGSLKNGLAERVICAMRVAGKLSFQQYWDDPRFQAKRAYFGSSRQRAYGDNIYHRDPAGGWIQERSHHSLENGDLNVANLRQDTSVDQVLWGDEFVYWGGEAPLIPAELRNHGGEDLYPAARDRRSIFAADFIACVDGWFRGLPRGRLGRPAAWPS